MTVTPTDADRFRLLGMTLENPAVQSINAYGLYSGPRLMRLDECGPIVVGHEQVLPCWFEGHAPMEGCCFFEVESPDFVAKRPPRIQPKTVTDLADAILKCAVKCPDAASVDSWFADRRGCRVVYLCPHVAKTMTTTIWLTQADLDGLESFLATTRSGSGVASDGVE